MRSESPGAGLRVGARSGPGALGGEARAIPRPGRTRARAGRRLHRRHWHSGRRCLCGGDPASVCGNLRPWARGWPRLGGHGDSLWSRRLAPTESVTRLALRLVTATRSGHGDSLWSRRLGGGRCVTVAQGRTDLGWLHVRQRSLWSGLAGEKPAARSRCGCDTCCGPLVWEERPRATRRVSCNNFNY